MTACGDSGATTQRAATPGAPSETVPTAPRPGRGHNAEEYKGLQAAASQAGVQRLPRRAPLADRKILAPTR
jgi:hypothetical protein